MSAREELFRRVAGSFVDEDRANGLIDAHAAEEYRKGYAAELREAADSVLDMDERIRSETWADEKGKRAVRTGVRLAETKLRRMAEGA